MVGPTTPTPFSAAKTARLGAELLQSRAHVNHAATLVSILRDSNAEGPQREALCALQAFFWTLMKNGELPAQNSKGACLARPTPFNILLSVFYLSYFFSGVLPLPSINGAYRTLVQIFLAQQLSPAAFRSRKKIRTRSTRLGCEPCIGTTYERHLES